MKQKFDLTTEGGKQEAAEALRSFRAMAPMMMPGIGPLLSLTRLLTDGVLRATESTLEEQRKTAVDLISEGAKSGAESIEITLDQRAGLNLDATSSGLPVSVLVGKSGKMTLKVKYK